MIINVGEDFHREIKLHAIDRNSTITHYVLQAVLERMAQEDKINLSNQGNNFHKN